MPLWEPDDNDKASIGHRDHCGGAGDPHGGIRGSSDCDGEGTDDGDANLEDGDKDSVPCKPACSLHGPRGPRGGCRPESPCGPLGPVSYFFEPTYQVTDPFGGGWWSCEESSFMQ